MKRQRRRLNILKETLGKYFGEEIEGIKEQEFEQNNVFNKIRAPKDLKIKIPPGDAYDFENSREDLREIKVQGISQLNKEADETWGSAGGRVDLNLLHYNGDTNEHQGEFNSK